MVNAEAGFRLYEILGTILVNKVLKYVVETLKFSKNTNNKIRKILMIFDLLKLNYCK